MKNPKVFSKPKSKKSDHHYNNEKFSIPIFDIFGNQFCAIEESN